MRERTPPAGLYGPMPEVGTLKECWFCHFMVTLSRADSGWYYWTAHRDPVDGRRHCDGGQPGNAHNPPVLTLHVPAPLLDAAGDPVERWAPRYTPDREARLH